MCGCIGGTVQAVCVAAAGLCRAMHGLPRVHASRVLGVHARSSLCVTCLAMLLPRPQEHSEWVTSVTWSPDGQQLASGSHDKTLRVWDVASGASVATLEVGDESLAVQPPGCVVPCTACHVCVSHGMWKPR
jgi:WD40 repeat protein